MKSAFYIAAVVVFSLVSAHSAHAGKEILVSAGASLTDSFREAGRAFEADNPGVRVIFNFASSGSLMRQVQAGAPVDVFASADALTMDRAEGYGLIAPGTRADFAENEMVMIVPASAGSHAENAGGVTAPGDLGKPYVKRVALGNPETVPAGRYARRALEALGLWDRLRPKFVYANSVRQVLDYVRRGEADAGFVYRTDAVLTGDAVELRAVLELDEPVLYPAAVTSGAPEPELAGRFVDFIKGPRGAAVLSRYGFTVPTRKTP